MGDSGRVPEVRRKMYFFIVKCDAFQLESAALLAHAAEGVSGGEAAVGKDHAVTRRLCVIGVCMECVAHASCVFRIKYVSDEAVRRHLPWWDALHNRINTLKKICTLRYRHYIA